MISRGRLLVKMAKTMNGDDTKIVKKSVEKKLDVVEKTTESIGEKSVIEEKLDYIDKTTSWVNKHFNTLTSEEYTPELDKDNSSCIANNKNNSECSFISRTDNEINSSLDNIVKSLYNEHKENAETSALHEKQMKTSFELPNNIAMDANALVQSSEAADDSRDLDFNIGDYSCESKSDDVSEILELQENILIDANQLLNYNRGMNTRGESSRIFESRGIRKPETLEKPLSEQLKMKKKTKKVVRCKFCDEDIISKNFMRHIERNHSQNNEVIKIMSMPKSSKERRQGMSLLRKDTNFDLYIRGETRPYRERPQQSDDIYYPCSSCKGILKKKYLGRHAKVCKGQTCSKRKGNYISQSQTLFACAIDKTKVISALNVKKQVFDLMKGDEIAFEAKKDLLIVHFGESYLKKHRRERISYACSNRMRELSRLLIAYRNVIQNKDISLKDLIHPKNFDNVIFSTREIVGYDPEKKSFKAPSLAIHLGTSLKLVCDELVHLILKESNGFKCHPNMKQLWLKDVKCFKKQIESRWNIELASLATKDLQEKQWHKPLLLPLVEDIKKFREETLKIAENCEKTFDDKTDNQNTYKLLVQCTLALLIIFNRRRIGDVQFLKIKDYKENRRSNFKDFENALTDAEKMLTKKYKRVLNSGKGSRAVVILVPDVLQHFIDVILKYREKYIISNENEYLFAIPGSTIKWGKGDVAIRMLTKKISLQNPESITSNKLRKQIATVTQILTLTKNEAKQFSKFMGHTEKTHDEFYELPIDVYQTAKISKLLLMMEKGTIPIEHQGKSLFEVDLEYPIENENDGDTEMRNTNSEIVDNITTRIYTNIAHEETTEEVACRSIDNQSALDADDHGTTKTKNKGLRQNWTTKEISFIKQDFGNNIKRKTYPSVSEIKEFLKKRKINRIVPVVKSKIQHLMRILK